MTISPLFAYVQEYPQNGLFLFLAHRKGITPRIARRGVEPSERLGRHRWVVERTLSWLNRYRRLKVRYDRRADVRE